MQIHNVEQGSDEWKQLRSGRPTASCFDKIVTASGADSTQAEAYENQLVAELLVGHPVEVFQGNAHTERGNELEQDAADFYSMSRNIDLENVGFVVNDMGAGCSPDRLIGDDGLLEIKCPAAHTHVKYLLGQGVDKAYMPQLQGQMWVTGRKWVDIISYHPEMKPVIIRVQRDEAYINALQRGVSRVIANVARKHQQLKGA